MQTFDAFVDLLFVVLHGSTTDDQVTRDIHGSSMDAHMYPMPPMSEYLWMTKLLEISMAHPWMYTCTPCLLCQSICG